MSLESKTKKYFKKLKMAGAICTLTALSFIPDGCATIVGTASGPITTPITYYRMCQAREENSFNTIILTSMGLLSGPIYGGICGANADWYFLTHGRYHPHYNFFYPWED